jgi:translocator protein
MKNFARLIISVLIPVAVGAFAGFFTSSSVKGWYATLNKPSFNPPNWIFAPVWTTLYIMMGIAFYLIWKSGAAAAIKKMAISFYSIQLILNFFWSILFFYLEQPGWAMIEIMLLWISIAATIYYFRQISVIAAWLLVPYILWVSFAMALNFAIWKLN